MQMIENKQQKVKLSSHPAPSLSVPSPETITVKGSFIFLQRTYANTCMHTHPPPTPGFMHIAMLLAFLT